MGTRKIPAISLWMMLMGMFFGSVLMSDAVLAKGKKGWLGVSVREMTPSMREAYGLGDRFGLLVTEVFEDSPAEKAGVQEEDVIVRFDGKPVEEVDEFIKMVRKTEPGKKVELTVVRDGREKTLEVIIGRRRARYAFIFRRDGEVFKMMYPGPVRLGVKVHELNEDLAAYFPGVDEGVLVLDVVEDSPAEDAGLKPGDVIVKVADETVQDPEDLIDALSEFDEGEEVAVQYVRNGKRETVEVELEETGFSHFRFMPRFFPGWWGNWNHCFIGDDGNGQVQIFIRSDEDEGEEI